MWTGSRSADDTSTTSRRGTFEMTEDDDQKLPARSRKAVDPAVQATRAQERGVGTDRLRHLQAAMESADDSDSTD